MAGSQSNDRNTDTHNGVETQQASGRSHSGRSSRSSSSKRRTHSNRSTHSNHSHRPSLSRRLSKRERTLFGALLILPWLVCLGLVAWHVYASIHTRKGYQDVLSRLGEAQEKLRAAAEENKTLSNELAELVEGRLPGNLHTIHFDQVINIENALTKNVLFTEIRRERQQGYEYRIVIENRRDERIRPHVRILVFDRLGIQIGTADIAGSPDWENLAAVGLGSGESHSFSGSIELTIEREPAYFMLAESTDRVPGV
jgi:hypothetical protein